MDILCVFRENLWRALGLFQEALGAMFTLINEMEMAIRINTLIIFGNSVELQHGSAQTLKAELCPVTRVGIGMWAA